MPRHSRDKRRFKRQNKRIDAFLNRPYVHHTDIPECRICRDAYPINKISPCRCDGSMKYVHAECLAMWRNTDVRAYKYTHCTVCRVQYGKNHAININHASRLRKLYTLVSYSPFYVLWLLIAFCLTICIILANLRTRNPETTNEYLRCLITCFNGLLRINRWMIRKFNVTHDDIIRSIELILS